MDDSPHKPKSLECLKASPQTSRSTFDAVFDLSVMLDITDFIAERGGDPERIRESQRRRGEPVEIVDEIIQMFEDHRTTNYGVTQIGSKINETQKEIGKKKKAKEDAEDLLKQKESLQKEKAAQEALAVEKLQALHLKAKTVGNYVHESVPISNDEVNSSGALPKPKLTCAGQ